MFAIECTLHDHRTLVSVDDILSIENTGHGIVLQVACWRGGVVTVTYGHDLAIAL